MLMLKNTWQNRQVCREIRVACESASRPRAVQGFKVNENGERVGYNTMVYSESEVSPKP